MPILVRAKLNPLGLSIPLHFPLRTWLLFFWGAHDGGFVQDGCGRGNGGDDSVGRYPIIIIIDAHIKGHTEMAIKNDSTQSVAPTGGCCTAYHFLTLFNIAAEMCMLGKGIAQAKLCHRVNCHSRCGF